MSFATNLKAAMEERQMSQTQLSGLSGIGKSSISQYLSGKNVPKVVVMEKLADALETSVEFLQGETDVSDAVSLTPMKNIPIRVAAALLGKGEQFVRVSLQRGTAPFGFATKIPKGLFFGSMISSVMLWKPFNAWRGSLTMKITFPAIAKPN